MLILSGEDIRAALPMTEAIRAVRWAYEAASNGDGIVPARVHLNLPHSANVSLFMPAYVPRDPTGSVPESLIVKAVSVFPGNPQKELPAVLGAALVLDPQTGASIALLDAAELTAIRTGAGSGVATDLLSRPESRTLAVFGTGGQALTQVEGICAVRSIDTVWVVGRDTIRGERFLQKVAGRAGVPADLRFVLDFREALLNADVICTTTTATEALFDPSYVMGGTHINAIGAFKPTMQEIPGQTVSRSRLFVDNRAGALYEAGDIVRAIDAGAIDATHIVGEIGEVIGGRVVGRRSSDEVTLFKSVGMAAQDAAAGGLAVARAEAQGIGRNIDW
jgi:ornithine cyclodeaminase